MVRRTQCGSTHAFGQSAAGAHPRTPPGIRCGERVRDRKRLFAELGAPFHLAVVRLEHAEWLIEQGRSGEGEPLLAEARETFERLEAKPWLERVEVATAARGAELPA